MRHQQSPFLPLTCTGLSIPAKSCCNSYTPYPAGKWVQNCCFPPGISWTQMRDPGQAPFNYFCLLHTSSFLLDISGWGLGNRPSIPPCLLAT